MTHKLTIKDEVTEFLLYSASNNQVKVEVLLNNENLWLTQKRMSELFGVGVPAISKHLDNIYDSNELHREATISILETVQLEGQRQVKRSLEYYNLDAVISVGYRVNSSQATQFRIWATTQLKELIIKGFVMDDDRLKNGRHFGKDYFNELLERVRSIRASERRIYLQITDIFAECTIDYDKNSDVTRHFYAFVQNKFHFAITGQTAAEIVHSHSDHSLPNMGLTTWKNAPEGRIIQSDVTVAKNYLQADEIDRLERTVSSFFDYIENIIKNRAEITMLSLKDSVDKFLNFNEYQVLDNLGHVRKSIADAKAKTEYQTFNKTQKINSDFDKLLKLTKSEKSKNTTQH